MVILIMIVSNTMHGSLISAWHDQPIVSRKIDKIRPEFLTTGLARDLIDMNTCIKASDMPVKAFDNVFFLVL